MSSDSNSIPLSGTPRTLQHERQAKIDGEARRRNPVKHNPHYIRYEKVLFNINDRELRSTPSFRFLGEGDKCNNKTTPIKYGWSAAIGRRCRCCTPSNKEKRRRSAEHSTDQTTGPEWTVTSIGSLSWANARERSRSESGVSSDESESD